jgi:release factor glutamine methyltransferase
VTIAEAINSAAKQLSGVGITDARFDAELLLRYVLNKDRAWLLAHIQDSLSAESLTSFQTLVVRREKREPVQHIIGTQEFWGLEFLVTPDVLIPRPETELIIETVLADKERLAGESTIVDLCTGSGCIAISLAEEFPSARIFATDRSAAALAIARKNAQQLDCAGRIRFFEGDLFQPLAELDLHGRVDIIVSNPPYVPDGVRTSLQPEVRDYEPALALFGGVDGTDLHRRIIQAAPEFLKKQGLLVMEIGIDQAETLKQVVHEDGRYYSSEVRKDLAGIDRVIAVQKR